MVKNKIEAVLFTLGRFASVEELSKLLNLPEQDILDAINNLKQEYQQKNTALAIQTLENKYKLNIKKEYSYLTNKLLSDTEIDKPATNTLAIIAYKSPVMQSEVIKIRGNKAYEHIKQLKDSSLITAEKQGRTKLLKLTPHFYDYFDIAEKEIKNVFEKLKNKMPDNQALKKLFEGNKC